MLTVEIKINGHPIVSASAVNKGKHPTGDFHVYKTNRGNVIAHHRDKGAIRLAIDLLENEWSFDV